MSRSRVTHQWRSINIERDIRSPAALIDYVVLPDRIKILRELGSSIVNDDHRALTLTGPCGIGKSKDLILLASSLDHELPHHRLATRLLEQPAPAESWHIAAITCTAEMFREQVVAAVLPFLDRRGKGTKSELDSFRFIHVVGDQSKDGADNRPILIVADELSRILEDARFRERNLVFLQDIAEAAQRASRQIVLLGALHRGLATYGAKQGLMQDDLAWIKVQGRFRDFTATLSFRDGFSLLAQTKEKTRLVAEARVVAQQLASAGELERPLTSLLSSTAPLTPMAAALLVSIARTGIGQNNRGLVGCLQDLHTSRVTKDSQIAPWHIWEWMTVHMGSALARSTLSSGWALACSCVQRASVLGEEALHVCQGIALLHLFGSHDGLVGNLELLNATLTPLKPNAIKKAIDDLLEARIITQRGYNNSYYLFEGSDFRLDLVGTGMEDVSIASCTDAIGELMTAAIAKQHYHATGTLRWFDIKVTPTPERARELAQETGTADGRLIAVLSDGKSGHARQLAKDHVNMTALVAFSDLKVDDSLRHDILEWQSLEHIRVHHPAMLSDAIARREVLHRLQPLRERIRQSIEQQLVRVEWWRPGSRSCIGIRTLSELASHLADAAYPNAPRIINEMLNRHRPSPNANAARTALCLAMLSRRSEPLLGIEKHPPERSLYDSLLARSGLHRPDPKRQGKFVYGAPIGTKDAETFAPVWTAIIDFLKESKSNVRPMSDLLRMIARPPYGVRAGVAPVIALVALIHEESRLAFYVDGNFAPELNDVWIEIMLRSPESVGVRWLGTLRVSDRTVQSIHTVANTLGRPPEDVEEGLKVVTRFFHGLDQWTRRTQLIPESTAEWREAFLNATDPIQLLKNELPTIMESATASLVDSVRALQAFVPSRLQELNGRICRAFAGSDPNHDVYAVVRARAKELIGKLGDLRLEAIAQRLATYDGNNETTESIAGVVVGKPLRQWVDRDWQQCLSELDVVLARMLDIEAFRHDPELGSSRVVLHVLSADGSRRVLGATNTLGLQRATLGNEFEEAVRQLKAIAKKSLCAEQIAAHVANELLLP